MAADDRRAHVEAVVVGECDQEDVPKYFLQNDFIDAVVFGEGDYVLPKMASELEKTGRISAGKGTSSWSHSGPARYGPMRALFCYAVIVDFFRSPRRGPS